MIKRLGMDIDGVIANFVQGLAPFARELGHVIDESRYDLGLKELDYLAVYDLMIDSGVYLDMQPYPDAVRCLNLWHHDGHQITYITRRRPGFPSEARTYAVQSQTLLWLRRHGFPNWHNVAFTQDKLRFCKERDIPILVEDYLPDANRFYGNTLNGQPLRCVLLDRPWNQGDCTIRVDELAHAERYFRC